MLADNIDVPGTSLLTASAIYVSSQGSAGKHLPPYDERLFGYSTRRSSLIPNPMQRIDDTEARHSLAGTAEKGLWNALIIKLQSALYLLLLRGVGIRQPG